MQNNIDKLQSLLKYANKIKTPLSLAGLAFIVLYLLYNKILSLKIFSGLSSDQTYLVIDKILLFAFIISIASLILGVLSYLVSIISRKHIDHPLINSAQKQLRKANIEIVDVEVINNADEFPIVEYKVRNNSDETAFIKGIELTPLRRWVIRQPSSPSAIPVSWLYDIILKRLGQKSVYRISQVIKPNEVDRFQIRIKGDSLVIIGQTLYLLETNFIYNENNDRTKKCMIIINMPSEVEVRGYFNPGYSQNLINKNKKVAITVKELIDRNDIKCDEEITSSLQSWIESPENKET